MNEAIVGQLFSMFKEPNCLKTNLALRWWLPQN